MLGDPAAVGALEELASMLRDAGYRNEALGAAASAAAASRFVLGHPVGREHLRNELVGVLVARGAADVVDGELVARFTLFRAGEAMVLVPRDEPDDPARVYFGRDSLWLAELARACVPGGRTHADLGTGAGAVAALVAPQFERAIATEPGSRAAACAALTLALNRRADGRPAANVARADVAGGLRPAAFDLVTANPPWMPDLAGARSPGALAYAEGGPTGFELPRRFVMEAASLLAPGGVSITLLLDATWRDGRRPLASLARGLQRLRLDTEIVPTGAEEAWPALVRSTLARVPGMAATRHVALVVRRPG